MEKEMPSAPKTATRGDGVSFAQYSERERLRAKFTVSGSSVLFEPQECVSISNYVHGLGTLSVVSGDRTEYQEQVSNLSAKEICDIASRAAGDKRTVIFNGVGWGGGSTYIVESRSATGERQRHLIAVIRDKMARASPGTLGSLSGIGNATDPIAAVLKEATEEVLLSTQSGNVLVPRFSNRFGLYNDLIRADVSENGLLMGLNPTDFGVYMGELRYPQALNGFSMRALFNYDLTDADRPRFNSFEVGLGPIIFRLPDSGEGSRVEFRDTLGIETGGKVPERAVAAINLDTTEVIIFEKGKESDRYGNIGAFFAENQYISDPDHPLIPVFAALMKVTDSDAQLFRMARDSDFLKYYFPQRAKELKMQVRG